MKKLITLFLALVLVVSMFAACSNPEGPAGESTPSKNNGNATPAPDASGNGEGGEEQPETNEYEAIGLPEDINLGEKEITIYAWDPDYDEFDVDATALDGDPVADAVYKKNLYTEQLLNVELGFYEWAYTDNNLGAMTTTCDNLKNAMSDGSTSVDIIANHPRVLATAVLKGLCSDLSTVDSIDLSKKWWPQSLKDELTIFDSMFFLSGDISSNLIYSIYSVFYNKTLAESYGLENIVQLVDDGEWTIDKFIEITNVGYEDIDTVNGKSDGDTFGIVFEWWNVDALVQSCGFKLLQNTADGIKLATNFPTPTFGDFVEKLGKWCTRDNVNNYGNYDSLPATIFAEGRSVFLISEVSAGFVLQDTDIEYGIVPMPMRDEHQEKYITTVSEFQSMYSISKNSKYLEDAGAVLQTLGYYGLQFTTPAVFEVTLQGKFSKDEDTMRILNTIRESVQFDLGLLYHRQINSISDIPTLAVKGNSQWSTAFNARTQKMTEKMIDDVNQTIKDTLGI